MKKILMGLMAISTLSFAAINLGTAAGDSNVWETGTKGKIDVEGFVSSSVPPVRYVVYSSVDGAYDPNGDKWNLNDIIVAQTEKDSKFSSTPNKVYVKRVNNGNTDVEALQSEKVSFTINRDPFFTNWFTPMSTGVGSTIELNQALFTVPISLLPKTVLEQLITDAGLTGGTVLPTGDIYLNGKHYRTFKYLKFSQTQNGVLEVAYENSAIFNANALTSADTKKVEDQLAAKKAISNVSITVTIE